MNSQFLKHDSHSNSPGLDNRQMRQGTTTETRPKAFLVQQNTHKKRFLSRGPFSWTCLHAASSLEIENWQPTYTRFILRHSNIFCRPQEVMMWGFLLWFNTNKSVTRFYMVWCMNCEIKHQYLYLPNTLLQFLPLDFTNKAFVIRWILWI